MHLYYRYFVLYVRATAFCQPADKKKTKMNRSDFSPLSPPSRRSDIHRRRRYARLRLANARRLRGGRDRGRGQRLREIPGDRAGNASIPADHPRHVRALSAAKVALVREEDGSVHPAAREAQHQRPEQSAEGETHQLPRDRMREVIRAAMRVLLRILDSDLYSEIRLSRRIFFLFSFEIVKYRTI